MPDEREPPRKPTRRPARPRAPEEPADELGLGATEEPSPSPPSRPVAVGRPAAAPRVPAERPPALSPEEPDAEGYDPELPGEDRPGFAWTAPAEEPPGSAPADEIERPMAEALVGVLGAVLAALVFTPWYRSGSISATGWSSGAWGPVVLAFGLAAVAIVVLRRLGVPLRFPVHHALVLEGIGWISVAALLAKLVWSPTLATTDMGVSWWLRGALATGLLLALAGGSVSQGVSLVRRPGWLAEDGGKLGAGVLGAALAVGATFGVLNNVEVPGLTNRPASPQVEPERGYPSCAENVGVPVPRGVEPMFGLPSQEGVCIATLQTRLTKNRTMNRYSAAFRDAGWSILFDARQHEEFAPLGQLQAQKGADCASVTVQDRIEGASEARVVVAVGPPDTYCNLAERLAEQQGS